MSPKWIQRFLDVAKTVASWSKDPNTHVGAVAVSDARAVLETGFNGLPRGVNDLPERMERPAKYLWTGHAEENLVAHAARPRLAGSTVFITHLCCSRCARLLINAGVAKIVCDAGTTSMPDEEFRVAIQALQEAGVELVRAVPASRWIGAKLSIDDWPEHLSIDDAVEWNHKNAAKGGIVVTGDLRAELLNRASYAMADLDPPLSQPQLTAVCQHLNLPQQEAAEVFTEYFRLLSERNAPLD